MSFSGFSDDFQHYLPISEETVKAAISSGMVILDTNVLLSAYRFAITARAELLSVLEKLSDRIWVPHQVALEFHRNRLEVISDQGAAYKQVLTELRTTQDKLNGQLSEKIHWLANRTGISDKRRTSLINSVVCCLQSAIHTVEELEAEHGTFDMLGRDDVLLQLQRILNNKVGLPFAEQEYSNAVAEAERRLKEGLPPGYKDADKKYPHGDYFIWRQSLAEAAKRDVDFLLFVTNDSKEDWYRILKGRSVGLRPELAREAWEHAGTRVVILTINQFLTKAKRYLGASVSSETIRQAEILPLPVTDEIAREVEIPQISHSLRQDLALDTTLAAFESELQIAKLDFEQANFRVSDLRGQQRTIRDALAQARRRNNHEGERERKAQAVRIDQALEEALSARSGAMNRLDLVRLNYNRMLRMLEEMEHHHPTGPDRPANEFPIA